MSASDDGLAEKLARIPYSDRVVLLPQCLRSNSCSAPKKKYGVVVCQECSQLRDDGYLCPIPDMASIARDIGYRDTYIFTGGSGIARFLQENGVPRAVLAVACDIELKEGKEMMGALGIPSQIEHLVKDGCSETLFFKEHADFREEWLRVLTRYPPAGE